MKVIKGFNGEHKPPQPKSREFEVPRWKSQVIGARSRRPRKVSLPKVEMREAKA